LTIEIAYLRAIYLINNIAIQRFNSEIL
jgi:hypothetical protein